MTADHISSRHAGPPQEAFDLGQVSEIARQALKKLVGENKPAILPNYEKVFYNTAIAMGESAMVDRLMAALPTGQAATIMVEKLIGLVHSMNQNLRLYREGIEAHNGELHDRQASIRDLVEPKVWEMVQEHLSGVIKANEEMHHRVLEAETRLASQEQQVATLQQKVRYDPLTGAFNRYALDEDVASEFARCSRYQRPVSVIMGDLDHFKKINDTYGHGNGDEVLKTFVSLMKKSLRDVDLVYRYGGEEFVVLLPETNLDGAAIAAERVRLCVERHILKHRTDSSLTIRITVSLGVASFESSDADYRAILERADQALYRAKNSGRNRVETARPEGV